MHNKSHSLSTNPEYVSSSLLTRTAFIASSTSTLSTATQEMPLNMYSIFVGPPKTGKLQAIIEYAVSLITEVVSDMDSPSPVLNSKNACPWTHKDHGRGQKGPLIVWGDYDMLFKRLNPTKKLPPETFKFSVSFSQGKRLPIGALKKEQGRFLQTPLSVYFLCDTSSICSLSCDALGPGTWSDR